MPENRRTAFRTFYVVMAKTSLMSTDLAAPWDLYCRITRFGKPSTTFLELYGASSSRRRAKPDWQDYYLVSAVLLEFCFFLYHTSIIVAFNHTSLVPLNVANSSDTNHSGKPPLLVSSCSLQQSQGKDGGEDEKHHGALALRLLRKSFLAFPNVRRQQPDRP